MDLDLQKRKHYEKVPEKDSQVVTVIWRQHIGEMNLY